MIVISDATPLHYLILIGYIELLPEEYGTVLIPGEVYRELTHSVTPVQVREWAESKPEWLEIRDVPQTLDIPDIDPGEREAITLALEMNADLLLVDDMNAREQARLRGIRIVGTLGILKQAVDRHRILRDEARERLEQTSYWVTKDLLDRVFGPLSDPISEPGDRHTAPSEKDGDSDPNPRGS